MTLDEAIKHAEEVAEEQECNAHVHKNMMVFKQSIKHNIAAKLQEESMNECIECAEEHRQLAKWLKELKHLRNLVTYSIDFHCSIEKAEKELQIAEDKIDYIESLNEEVDE